MSRRARRAPGMLARLIEGALSLVDLLAGGLGRLGVGLIAGLFRAALFVLRGAIRALFWAVLWPLRALFRALFARRNAAERCLVLTGEEFEAYAAKVLRDNGFRHIELTPMGGDQGVDILAVYRGESWAIQCKNYAAPVGNAAVQEACAGREYYRCDRAAVLCPGSYTRAARELAESTDVVLWDGDDLSRMMKRSGRRPRPGRE